MAKRPNSMTLKQAIMAYLSRENREVSLKEMTEAVRLVYQSKAVHFFNVMRVQCYRLEDEGKVVLNRTEGKPTIRLRDPATDAPPAVEVLPKVRTQKNNVGGSEIRMVLDLIDKVGKSRVIRLVNTLVDLYGD